MHAGVQFSPPSVVLSMVKDQVFMVSGATRGIGYSVARMAAQQGAKLAICSRTEADLTRAATEIKGETGADTLTVAADLRSIESTALFIQKTIDRYGRVDALVNCAGDARNGDPLALPDSAWSSAWELKVFGYVRLSLGVLPHMRDRSYGRIVNVIGYGDGNQLRLGSQPPWPMRRCFRSRKAFRNIVRIKTYW